MKTTGNTTLEDLLKEREGLQVATAKAKKQLAIAEDAEVSAKNEMNEVLINMSFAETIALIEPNVQPEIINIPDSKQESGHIMCLLRPKGLPHIGIVLECNSDSHPTFIGGVSFKILKNIESAPYDMLSTDNIYDVTAKDLREYLVSEGITHIIDLKKKELFSLEPGNTNACTIDLKRLFPWIITK